MPGLNGIEVIAKCKELSPDTDAVVLTGKSSLETAVAGAAARGVRLSHQALQAGRARRRCCMRVAEQAASWINKYRALKHQLERRRRQDASSSAAAAAMEQVQAADREGRADELHRADPRRNRHRQGAGRPRRASSTACGRDMPFVAVNCGALPETLIESELFGHRKGAFTGADEHRVGPVRSGPRRHDLSRRDRRAAQGDAGQAAARAGKRRDSPRGREQRRSMVDVRVVCATHRNLPEMVEAGDFREDLMYRINTFEIHLPPLRERIDDIPALAEHLFRRFRPQPEGRRRSSSRPKRSTLLQSTRWPGNVRELANVIEHATILCDSGPITPRAPAAAVRQPPRPAAARSASPAPITLRELEMQAIHDALDRHGGNKPEAADELGISLKTLYNKLNQTALLEKAA